MRWIIPMNFFLCKFRDSNEELSKIEFHSLFAKTHRNILKFIWISKIGFEILKLYCVISTFFCWFLIFMLDWFLLDNLKLFNLLLIRFDAKHDVNFYINFYYLNFISNNILPLWRILLGILIYFKFIFLLNINSLYWKRRTMRPCTWRILFNRNWSENFVRRWKMGTSRW